MAEYKTTVTETEDGGRTITSGDMTKQEAARLAAERERTKNMNTSDSASAASDALDKDMAAKKRYIEMQNILASGKHKSMSDEEKAAFVKEYKKLKLDYSFNEGGAVPMNSMAKQMDMFDDGGLMDEGGTIDPVSGNDVPSGSTQKEVRDDIPAQLSEGEFVFPADVVRYHGLDKLMALRDEAKRGLARMEAMGQMGNSEEATIPDGVPFDIDDLEIEDDGLEMNVGGLVGSLGGNVIGAVSNNQGVAQNLMGPMGTPMGSVGTFQYTPPPSQTGSAQVIVYGPDGTAYPNPAAAQAAGVTNPSMTPPTNPTGKATTPIEAASAKFQPLAGTKFTPAPVQTSMPTFRDTIGMGVPYVDYDPNKLEETPAEESPSVQPAQTVVAEAGDGGDNIDEPSTTGSGSISDIVSGLKGLLGGGSKDVPRGKSVGDIFESAADKNNYFGGSKDFGFGNEALRKGTFTQAGAQAGTLGLTGIVTELTKAAGITNFSVKDIGVAGFNGMNSALNSLGLTNRGQLMNDAQATLVGQAMTEAHVAALKGRDPKAAVASVLNTKQAREVQNAAYNAIKNGYAEKAGAKSIEKFTNKDFANEMSRVERSAVSSLKTDFSRPTTLGMTAQEAADAEASYRSNVVTDRNGNPVRTRDITTGKLKGNVLTEKGKTEKDRLTAIANQARVNREQAEKKAAEDAAEKAAQDAARQQAERDRYRSEFADEQNDGGPPPGATPASMSTSDIGAMSPEDVAGMFDGQSDNEGGGYDSDPGNFGASDSFAKGGLASQMKRSGLASKK